MTAPESPRADVGLTERQAQDVAATIACLLAGRIDGQQAVATTVAQVDRILADQHYADERAFRAYADRHGWCVDGGMTNERCAASVCDCGYEGQTWNALRARAEAAEAERDDLRAQLLAVETLADECASRPCIHLNDLWGRLHAVLARPSTEQRSRDHD